MMKRLICLFTLFAAFACMAGFDPNFPWSAETAEQAASFTNTNHKAIAQVVVAAKAAKCASYEELKSFYAKAGTKMLRTQGIGFPYSRLS